MSVRDSQTVSTDIVSHVATITFSIRYKTIQRRLTRTHCLLGYVHVWRRSKPAIAAGVSNSRLFLRYVMEVIQRGRTAGRPALIPPLSVVPAVSDTELFETEYVAAVVAFVYLMLPHRAHHLTPPVHACAPSCSSLTLFVCVARIQYGLHCCSL